MLCTDSVNVLYDVLESGVTAEVQKQLLVIQQSVD